MNTTLWIMQAILAVVFATSGLIIMVLPKEKLAPKLSWVAKYSNGLRNFICSSKILGAIGLVLPMYLNILPILTPIASVGIALIMSFAMAYHFKNKEYKDVPATVLFLAMSVFVAYNRF